MFVVGLTLGGPVSAQSDSGLKLGEEPAEQTLDLGAGPAAPDAPATAPEPPPAPEGTIGTDQGGARTGAADPAGAGAPVASEDIVRTAHGDWEVACAPGGAKGGCAMAQIGNDATGTPVLEMVVRKLPEPLEVNEQTAVAVLDVITPLGVVLTEGLTMKIDGGPDESAAFQICTEQGCLVREPVGDDLITRLKRGSVAKVSVFAANQGEVTSDISLKGFTAAYGATR